MKKLFALAVVALITAPAGAHSVRTSDGFEVEPTGPRYQDGAGVRRTACDFRMLSIQLFHKRRYDERFR